MKNADVNFNMNAYNTLIMRSNYEMSHGLPPPNLAEYRYLKIDLASQHCSKKYFIK